MTCILALDQGTTSSRSVVFDGTGNIVSFSQKEFPQYFPQSAWVEHDPEEIWTSQMATAREALEKAGLSASDLAGIGIANQRETSLVWDRRTGKPVARAIVWQCRRTTSLCGDLKAEGLEPLVRSKTGLFIDPYFSATKIMWYLKNVPGLRDLAGKGNAAFGTVDSWLVWKLTGRHVTDVTNASRTMLFNIHTASWDEELLRLFDIPESMLPEVVPSSGVAAVTKKDVFGAAIPVAGIAGDQQAALFGQGCFAPGSVKNTYGTGCFTLMHTGKNAIRSENNLITTIAWNTGDGVEYALEGSVFTAGAVVQWLRDKLGAIQSAGDTEALALSVADSGGVYMVPAFNGLGAPYWAPETRGTILGITRGTERAHIVRAALESIAYQSADLIRSMEKDAGKKIETLRVDGGASMNAFLMQFQSDILGIPVERSAVIETTAFGAACLAGLAIGVFASREELLKYCRAGARFSPRMSDDERRIMLSGWGKAVEASMSFTAKPSVET